MHQSTAEAGLSLPVVVILATRGRPEALRLAVRSILANTYPNFRLVIIDQTPGDEPPFAPGELPEGKVTYIRTLWSGKSRAINHALTLGDEPIVAFTDDDCTVPPDWLAKGAAALAAEPSAGLLFGSFTAAAHNPGKEFIPEFRPASRRVARGAMSLWNGILGYGGNLFARRDALAAVGGFDEELGPGGRFRTGEDLEITFRTLCNGFPVVQDPDVEATHHGGRSLAGGAARACINDAYYSIGAGYGKHVRAGSGRAALLFAREVELAALVVVRNVLRGRLRAIGARGLLGLVQGARAGFWDSTVPARRAHAAVTARLSPRPGIRPEPAIGPHLPLSEPGSVSVAICTKERPRVLRHAIASVLRSDAPFGSLLVVDQSATPQTERVVRRFARVDGRVLYRKRPAEGVSTARNFALGACDTEFILFTDDDCRVGADWVGHMSDALRGDASAALAFGQVVPAACDPREGFIVGYRVMRRRRLTGRRSKLLDGGIGANMAVRRSTIIALGGFDRYLGPGAEFRACEDGDLSYRALKHGGAVLHVPESVVTHYGLRTWREGTGLVRDTFVAVGAAYFKHVRAGDPIGLLLLLQQFGFALRECGSQAVQGKRPLGMGRLLALGLGIWRSFELPVDRRTALYRRPEPAAAAAASPEPIRTLSVHRTSTANRHTGAEGRSPLLRPGEDGDVEHPFEHEVETRRKAVGP
ncbi:MAG: glycosyltransferase [Dehalococcoidia bacterium]